MPVHTREKRTVSVVLFSHRGIERSGQSWSIDDVLGIVECARAKFVASAAHGDAVEMIDDDGSMVSSPSSSGAAGRCWCCLALLGFLATYHKSLYGHSYNRSSYYE